MKRTLGILTADGLYTNAAALMADENDFPATDIAVFGDSINEFRDRTNTQGVSLLAQYQASLDMYERYCVSEIVEGATRRRVEDVPLEAYREAVANALVHRTWDMPANITVGIFPDRVEIVSPGSLPQGISKNDYIRGGVSLPRNPLLATIFFRLNIVERFGTGIRRIRAAYDGSSVQPKFDVRDNSIAVTLPKTVAKPAVTADEKRVLQALGKSVLLPRSSVEVKTGLSKEKTIRLLNSLEERGLVVREGRGRGARYRLA